MTYGADEVQRRLRYELEHYLITQYLAKTPVLVEALQGRLDKEGILYRAPYIEAAPAYETVPDGIAQADVPAWAKELFHALAEHHLGVYPAPFCHQIQALEAFFAGRDIFVATGTGSGKTECFLWPLLAKLVGEAREQPKAWRMRGVRSIVMYPMNALVSDQVSRLRRLIGDPAHAFRAVLRKVAGDVRRPQFGMYTGRTPYPGCRAEQRQDAALARTLSALLPEAQDAAFYEKLLASGKIPAKEDLAAFLARVRQGDHFPDPEDAELITRFEMQHVTPDILVTNYSMLEYMLLRPIEAHLWEETRAWLQADGAHRLLFIIDEAHMYRGSSGGEVALLLRRLLHRLGIDRDRVQFILTTASMPASSPEDTAAVRSFAVELTGARDFSRFTYLTGTREDISARGGRAIPREALRQAAEHLEDFSGDESKQLAALHSFFSAAGVEASDTWKNLADARTWLFEHLLDFDPFHVLVTRCRGEAVSLAELSKAIFPRIYEKDAETSLRFVSVLLAIAPFARSAAGAVLFPARMHMLFRGLHGIYACTNPACPHHTQAGGLRLGEVFLDDSRLTCPLCHSTVYELHYDRRCGALFYHGYVMEDAIRGGGTAFLWRYPGELMDRQLKEIELYLPPDGYRAKKDRTNPILPCYLDTKSAFLRFGDDVWDGRPGVRKLYYGIYHKKGQPDAYTFPSCPHCGHPFGRRQLASFSTRGNASFYNLVRAQFQLQPPVPGKEDTWRYPNQGRKVLLFSDSRQRAARLARDMSNASDREAARKLFAIAVQHMREDKAEHSLDELYGFFCQAAAERHVILYHGADRDAFLQGMKRAQKSAQRHRAPRLKTKDAPDSFKITELQLFTGAYNTVYDTALGWLEPMQDAFDDVLYTLEDAGINTNADGFDEDLRAFLHAWWIQIFGTHAALAGDIGDEIREQFLLRIGRSFGLLKDWKFSDVIRKIMGWNKRSEEMAAYHKALEETFLLPGANQNWYVDTSRVKPVFYRQAPWYRCNKCSEITPMRLRGHCPNCGSDDIHEMTAVEMDALAFWRAPVFDALDGGPVRVIDTEEHTAQLSRKDQRDDVWSQTESYELRFQDLVAEGERPVDILSSTTTMEVGIDIGSLVAVGLRNIPPMRENYQQRAGRAGRRGNSLSTIVTFCEDGPHDSFYFHKPESMLRGDPRRPWIDDCSPKLLDRHVTLVSLVSFLAKHGESIDQIPAWSFFHNGGSAAYLAQAQDFAAVPHGSLLPFGVEMDWGAWQEWIAAGFQKIADSIQRHPELYGVDASGIGDYPKSLLDALYEEGLIPTYSFPKNVVSLYTFQGQRVKYAVERGLDVAISEDAPGRSVVVDKETYQIGGLYTPHSEFRKGYFQRPARAYIEDPNYCKTLYACSSCNWFGFEEPEGDICPFCGEKSVGSVRDMVRPWGFAPKEARPIPEAQLAEAFSSALPPVYSTLPEGMMHPVKGWNHVRMAQRTNQRILMVNQGPDGKGFMICEECGAAVPGDDASALHGIRRPYPGTRMTCHHSVCRNIDLGYDFVTDMLVLEIPLDNPALDAGRKHPSWLQRAALSLAEALRITVSKELDIEYTELVSGCRIRQQETGACVDIYIYDSLSSGAGYAIRLSDDVPAMLQASKQLLTDCNCDSACNRCLKHYRNQYIHPMLDRHAALRLLDWAETGKLPSALSVEAQWEKLRPLADILAADGCSLFPGNSKKPIYISRAETMLQIIIYPWMKKSPLPSPGVLTLPDALLKYAKPYALSEIQKALRKV